MAQIDLSQMTAVQLNGNTNDEAILSVQLNGTEIWGKTYTDNYVDVLIGTCTQCEFIPACTVCVPCCCYQVGCYFWFLQASDPVSWGAPSSSTNYLYNGSWYSNRSQFTGSTQNTTWTHLGNDPVYNHPNIWQGGLHEIVCCQGCCESFYECTTVDDFESRNCAYWSYRWPGCTGTPPPACSCYVDIP